MVNPKDIAGNAQEEEEEEEFNLATLGAVPNPLPPGRIPYCCATNVVL